MKQNLQNLVNNLDGAQAEALMELIVTQIMEREQAITKELQYKVDGIYLAPFREVFYLLNEMTENLE